jgi:Flp pilus assembly protein TadD
MNRTLASAALLLVCVLLVPSAQAQISTVYGSVFDPDKKPVADAEVKIENLSGATRPTTVKTDAKGEWLQMIRPGPYRFTVTMDGYQPFVFEWRMTGDQVRLPPVTLQPGGGISKKVLADFNKAVELTNASKYDEAEVIYREILSKHPDLVEAQLNLGLVLSRKKDWAGAEAAYLKALELRTDSADATLSLAGVYQQSGQAEKAKPLIEKPVPTTDANLLFRRGLLLLNAMENDPAGEAFQAALAIDPTMAEAYFRLGSVKLNQGKIPEAIADLEKYLTLNPTDTANIATAQGLIQALKK